MSDTENNSNVEMQVAEEDPYNGGSGQPTPANPNATDALSLIGNNLDPVKAMMDQYQAAIKENARLRYERDLARDQLRQQATGQNNLRKICSNFSLAQQKSDSVVPNSNNNSSVSTSCPKSIPEKELKIEQNSLNTISNGMALLSITPSNNIENYKGGSPWAYFEKKLLNFATLTKMDPNSLFLFACSKLEGRAADCFEKLEKMGEIKDFIELCEKMSQFWPKEDGPKHKESEFYQCNQLADESVTKYAARLRLVESETLQISNPVEREKKLSNRLVDGLHSEILRIIIMGKPAKERDTIEKCVHLIRPMEQIAKENDNICAFSSFSSSFSEQKKAKDAKLDRPSSSSSSASSSSSELGNNGQGAYPVQFSQVANGGQMTMPPPWWWSMPMMAGGPGFQAAYGGHGNGQGQGHGGKVQKPNRGGGRGGSRGGRGTGRGAKQPTGELAGGKKPDEGCYNCGGNDHGCRKCPMMQCFKCKEHGHMACDCPKEV